MGRAIRQLATVQRAGERRIGNEDEVGASDIVIELVDRLRTGDSHVVRDSPEA